MTIVESLQTIACLASSSFFKKIPLPMYYSRVFCIQNSNKETKNSEIRAARAVGIIEIFFGSVSRQGVIQWNWKWGLDSWPCFALRHRYLIMAWNSTIFEMMKPRLIYRHTVCVRTVMERDELLSEALRIGIECNEFHTRSSGLFKNCYCYCVAVHSTHSKPAAREWFVPAIKLESWPFIIIRSKISLLDPPVI